MVSTDLVSLGLVPGLLAPLASLHSLDLRNNKLGALHEGSLQGLVSLNTLNLYENEVRVVECGALNQLQWLEHLNLGENPAACTLDRTSGIVTCTCAGGPRGFTSGSLGYCSAQDVCPFPNPSMYGAEHSRDTHPRGWKLLNPRTGFAGRASGSSSTSGAGALSNRVGLADELKEQPLLTDKLIRNMLAGTCTFWRVFDWFIPPLSFVAPNHLFAGQKTPVCMVM